VRLGGREAVGLAQHGERSRPGGDHHHGKHSGFAAITPIVSTPDTQGRVPAIASSCPGICPWWLQGMRMAPNKRIQVRSPLRGAPPDPICWATQGSTPLVCAARIERATFLQLNYAVRSGIALHRLKSRCTRSALAFGGHNNVW
jgi:hypothetical protein